MSDAGDQPVGRAHAFEVRGFAAAALRRDGELAVFQEVAAVEEMSQVLARGTAAERAPLLDGIRPAVIADRAPSLDHFGEIGAQLVEIDVRIGTGVFELDLGRLDEQHRITGVENRARLRRDRAHDPGQLGDEHVLHLHRFDHGEPLSARDRRTDLDVDREQTSGRRRAQRSRIRRSIHRCTFARSVRGRLGRAESMRTSRPQLVNGGSAGGELARVLRDEARVHVVRGDIRVLQERGEERQVRRHTVDAELAQRSRGEGGGVREIAVRRVHDHFREQRVEAWVRTVAAVAERVDANARPGRRLERGQRAARRHHLAVRCDRLQVDAHLDRDAARRRRGKLQAELRQRRAARDAQLGDDEIDAGDRLGHGVLHLQARVGLDERKGIVPLFRVDQELERAEAVVPRSARQRQRRVDEPRAQRRRQARRGRDLDELLIAALQRAVAFPQMRHLAR